MKNLLVLLILAGLFTAGCYYDNEEDLYPGGCNTENVGYAADIVPVVNANCLSCHSTAAGLGGVRLQGYDAIKVWVNNGRLLGAVRHDTGFSRMPQNASKLSACTIAKIEKWIADGAPNN